MRARRQKSFDRAAFGRFFSFPARMTPRAVVRMVRPSRFSPPASQSCPHSIPANAQPPTVPFAGTSLCINYAGSENCVLHSTLPDSWQSLGFLVSVSGFVASYGLPQAVNLYHWATQHLARKCLTDGGHLAASASSLLCCPK